MGTLFEIFREILVAIGIDLVKKAPAVLKKTVESQNSNPTSNDDDTFVDETALMFDKDNPFRTWIENVITRIAKLREALENTSTSIIFSVSSSIVPRTLVELLLKLYDDKSITVEYKDGKTEVKYDFNATKELIQFARSIFELHFKTGFDSNEKQSLRAHIPELVGSFISEVFRSRGIRPFNYSVSIYDSTMHKLYTDANQVDIFGNELIWGRMSIIKYKDDASNVFTYAIVIPEKANFDGQISNENFDLHEILGSAKRAFNIADSDLEVYPIMFDNLEYALKKVYKK